MDEAGSPVVRDALVPMVVEQTVRELFCRRKASQGR